MLTVKDLMTSGTQSSPDGKHSECYKATVAAEKEAKALRAALSVVDAQVHQQAELLAQRWDALSTAEPTIASLTAERDRP